MNEESRVRHPIQPLQRDKDGALRFKENKIVRFLLDNGPHDMNGLARMDFSQEDREQFAQLIGYSFSGFATLSYVSEDTYNTAAIMASRGSDERDARIEVLQAAVDRAREGVAKLAGELFRIHPDDFFTEYL